MLKLILSPDIILVTILKGSPRSNSGGAGQRKRPLSYTPFVVVVVYFRKPSCSLPWFRLHVTEYSTCKCIQLVLLCVFCGSGKCPWRFMLCSGHGEWTSSCTEDYCSLAKCLSEKLIGSEAKTRSHQMIREHRHYHQHNCWSSFWVPALLVLKSCDQQQQQQDVQSKACHQQEVGTPDCRRCSNNIKVYLPICRGRDYKTVKCYCHSGCCCWWWWGVKVLHHCFNSADDNNDFLSLIGQMVNIIFNGL